jgi:TrwC relaxase
VAKGRENYYTGAVAAGEPPGRWYGKGAAKHGLTGLVDEQDLLALYEHFVDPADPGVQGPVQVGRGVQAWSQGQALGRAVSVSVFCSASAARSTACAAQRMVALASAGSSSQVSRVAMSASSP